MTSELSTPTGVLLTNLGTPFAPTAEEVRRYLAEFLSDRRVISLSPVLWWPILHGIILRRRPQRSAHLYQKVWMGSGSPLLVYGRKQSCALQKYFQNHHHPVHVALGMRYGRPSIDKALDQLKSHGIRQLIVLPLYPQYSDSTTASTFDAVNEALSKRPSMPAARFISNYADNPGYIQSCATQIRNFRTEHGANELLLLSFHGLPAESIRQGDPYAHQCHDTARRIAAELELTEKEWRITFQSRFGPKKWLEPYTDETLRALPAQGVESVDVFCPGFAADCLETLEEIEQENQAVFREAGGHKFHYIPALNSRTHHIHALAHIVKQHLHP